MATVNLSQKEAEQLILLKKKIVIDDKLLDEYTISRNKNLFGRFQLSSLDGNNQFLLKITQGLRKFKITLHFQENNQYVGLLRVDYDGYHKNPETVNEHVPDFAKKYIGKTIESSHVHFFVEGYKTLNWAVPIYDYDFSIKDLSNESLISDAIEEFCNKINLCTTLQYERRLFL